MGSLTLTGIHKSFGSVEVLHDINLDVPDGEFVIFVGPSGCGKSTLLRIVAGLEDATSGAVQIGGKEVGHLPPSKRGIAMVFQTYALYPHLTVRDNMALGLRQAGTARDVIASQVERASQMLELGPYMSRRPAELSGGQRQRVAIGRALVREPELFLFDEPLSNLDAALRVNMRMEIARLHRELSTTMVYVTHDQIEAMTLADRIVVLRDGRIEQTGAPMELYNDPDNLFVAQFIGSPAMNILPGELLGQGSAVVSGGVRPESIGLAPGEQGVSGVISHLEHLGADTFAYLRVGDHIVSARLPGYQSFEIGMRYQLLFDPHAVFRFDAQGKRMRSG